MFPYFFFISHIYVCLDRKKENLIFNPFFGEGLKRFNNFSSRLQWSNFLTSKQTFKIVFLLRASQTLPRETFLIYLRPLNFNFGKTHKILLIWFSSPSWRTLRALSIIHIESSLRNNMSCNIHWFMREVFRFSRILPPANLHGEVCEGLL